MTRYRQTKDGKIKFTPEQEAARDLEEQAWEDGKDKRLAKKKIRELEDAVTHRRLRDAVLGTDDGWLEAQEAKIATERGKL